MGRESQVADTKLVEVKTSYHTIKTSSAIDECTPSLENKDFAKVALGCHPSVLYNESNGYIFNYDFYMESNGYYYDYYDLWQICVLRKKGWLKEDGTIDEDIFTKYNELDGVEN